MVVLLAALPFLCLFTELWIGQYYPTLLVLPFYAIGCASLALLLLNGAGRMTRFAGAALAFALFANSLTELLSFKKAYFDRSAIASLKANLDSLADPGQHILVDHNFDAAYRYYFSHNIVELILNPPGHYAASLQYYANPRLIRVAPPRGALFIHHKRLADELYDKSYYYILGRVGLWGPWGNPEAYHSELDAFITARDSELLARVAERGTKIVDTDAYEIWRLRPTTFQPDSTQRPGETLGAAPGKDESHLTKIDR
jgi:hypothetical protein